jgi:hypothetical protein
MIRHIKARDGETCIISWKDLLLSSGNVYQVRLVVILDVAALGGREDESVEIHDNLYS